MLKEHGSLAEVEVHVAKRNVKSNKQSLGGGWYTELALSKQYNSSKTFG